MGAWGPEIPFLERIEKPVRKNGPPLMMLDQGHEGVGRGHKVQGQRSMSNSKVTSFLPNGLMGGATRGSFHIF